MYKCGAMRVTGEAPCTRGDSLSSMARDCRTPELRRPSVNSSARRRKLQRDVSWSGYQRIRRGPLKDIDRLVGVGYPRVTNSGALSTRMRPCLPQGIHIGLRVIEEVSREYSQPQVSKRVGQLLIAPAGLLSGLPGGAGNVSRIGSRF